MGEDKLSGFEYQLDEEIIKRYQEKSLELRLKWLYFGNLLRKQYPKEIIELQDRFRDNR